MQRAFHHQFQGQEILFPGEPIRNTEKVKVIEQGWGWEEEGEGEKAMMLGDREPRPNLPSGPEIASDLCPDQVRHTILDRAVANKAHVQCEVRSEPHHLRATP